MTDESHYPDDAEDRSDNQQQAREACQHALDALHDGDLARAQSLLDEAGAAVERAQHDDTEQAYRETAYDCYD
jgi:cellobiose-specific phosphotransferase system component IIA